MLGSAPETADLSHALARQAGFSSQEARLLGRT